MVAVVVVVAEEVFWIKQESNHNKQFLHTKEPVFD